MSVSNLKYSNINAKLKGMSAKKLDQNDLYNLIKQVNYKSAVYYLKQELPILNDIDENIDRPKLEQELNKLIINDIYKINHLLSKKEQSFLHLFISKYEIDCIIIILKRLTMYSTINENLPNVELWTSRIFNKIDGISTASNEEEFLKKIEKSTYSKFIYNYIKQNNDIYNISISDLELSLDKLYFSNLFKNSKYFGKSVINIFGEQIDLLNISWIYRLKKNYKLSSLNINGLLIPTNYKLKKEEMLNMINAINLEDFFNILKTTFYSKIIGNNKNFEYNINLYLYSISKKGFAEAKYNISTVIHYLILEEFQKSNIINILGGLNYNLPKSDIQKKIII